MTTYAFAILYILGAAATFRGLVWFSANSWPSLAWGFGDTIFTLILSLVWPLSAPTFFLIFISDRRSKKPKRAGWVARMHDRDRRKVKP